MASCIRFGSWHLTSASKSKLQEKDVAKILAQVIFQSDADIFTLQGLVSPNPNESQGILSKVLDALRRLTSRTVTGAECKWDCVVCPTAQRSLAETDCVAFILRYPLPEGVEVGPDEPEVVTCAHGFNSLPRAAVLQVFVHHGLRRLAVTSLAVPPSAIREESLHSETTSTAHSEQSRRTSGGITEIELLGEGIGRRHKRGTADEDLTSVRPVMVGQVTKDAIGADAAALSTVAFSSLEVEDFSTSQVEESMFSEEFDINRTLVAYLSAVASLTKHTVPVSPDYGVVLGDFAVSHDDVHLEPFLLEDFHSCLADCHNPRLLRRACGSDAYHWSDRLDNQLSVCVGADILATHQCLPDELQDREAGLLSEMAYHFPLWVEISFVNTTNEDETEGMSDGGLTNELAQAKVDSPKKGMLGAFVDKLKSMFII